jgi:transposase
MTRFPRSRKLVSYLGRNPSEASSGGRRRLGAISKQGNTMMRWLLIEAASPAVRCDPELRQHYLRLKFRRGHAVAKVAMARKLSVRMYWMLRTGAAYAQLVRKQSSPGGTPMDASSSLT